MHEICSMVEKCATKICLLFFFSISRWNYIKLSVCLLKLQHWLFLVLQCDPGIGINVMFHQLFTPPTKMAIMGDGCSIVSEVTARASHLWNLVQVTLYTHWPSGNHVSPNICLHSNWHSLCLLSDVTEEKLMPRFYEILKPVLILTHLFVRVINSHVNYDK